MLLFSRRDLRKIEACMDELSEYRKILIIEDDEFVSHMLHYAMESYGFQVAVCGNADEAIREMTERPPDYVITDYDLPGLNGTELTQWIRKMFPMTIIIGISGHDKGEEFLNSGAHDFRRKPVVPYELAMMIDGLDLPD